MVTFQLIPADQVKPGDIHKFTPTSGKPVYHEVVEVIDGFVAIKTTYKGRETNMFVRANNPQVSFGRRIDVSTQTPANA